MIFIWATSPSRKAIIIAEIKSKYWIFTVSLMVVLLDQVAKWMIKTFMQLGQSLPVLGERFFRLTYIENTGIAFGIPFGGRIFLIIFTVAAVVFLLYYILKN